MEYLYLFYLYFFQSLLQDLLVSDQMVLIQYYKVMPLMILLQPNGIKNRPIHMIQNLNYS